MTLPSSGNNPPISLADINAEFGLGTSLSAYKNTRWFKDDNSRGAFFNVYGIIALSDFYSKRVNSPVIAGSATLDRATWNAKNYPFPMFNNLSVTAYSGQGGTAGVNGNCANAGAGGTGASSAFGTYAVTSTGANAANGGAGTITTASASWAISDANQSSILALYGTNVAITAGAGGTAGTPGYNTRAVNSCVQYAFYGGIPVCTWLVTSYYCDSSAGAGTAGADGYISVSWT